MIQVAATDLKKWFSESVTSPPDEHTCNRLYRDFGSALPFFIKPDLFKTFPFAALGQEYVNIKSLTPSVGEAWVLFCYPGLSVSDKSPLRSDGFMLPFEWRKGTEHSRLIPQSLKELADKVLAHMPGDPRSLHPSFIRFGDHVDFSDEALFGESVSSAWGALAAGLIAARQGIVPQKWPFSSLNFDPATGTSKAVDGIEAKLLVASSFSCTEFIVAPSQLTEAEEALEVLQVSSSCPGIKQVAVSSVDAGNSSLGESVLFSHLDWLRPVCMPSFTDTPFVGREWLLDRVRQSMEDGDFTLVSGGAGCGKSALLSRVVRDANSQLLAGYICSRRPTIEFIRTVAFRIAAVFPEAFSRANIDAIRELLSAKSSWDNLRALYEAAVVEPLRHVKDQSGPMLLIVDALNETPDRNLAALLSDEDLQLPAWLRLMVSCRPTPEITQLFNRRSVRIIDLDSAENAAQCNADLAAYIRHKIEENGYTSQGCTIGRGTLARVTKSSILFEATSAADQRELIQLLERKCTSYRYAHCVFLNIQNGTYTFDSLESRLPAGLQGHYLAFFNTLNARERKGIRTVLELLLAVPGGIEPTLLDELAGDSCDVWIARLRGYVVKRDSALAITDESLCEWLSEEHANQVFHIDRAKGSLRVSEYGWKIVVNETECINDGEDIGRIKRRLPGAVRDGFVRHAAVSGFIRNGLRKGVLDAEGVALLISLAANDDESALALAAQKGNHRKSRRSVVLGVIGSIILLSAATVTVVGSKRSRRELGVLERMAVDTANAFVWMDMMLGNVDKTARMVEEWWAVGQSGENAEAQKADLLQWLEFRIAEIPKLELKHSWNPELLESFPDKRCHMHDLQALFEQVIPMHKQELLAYYHNTIASIQTPMTWWPEGQTRLFELRRKYLMQSGTFYFHSALDIFIDYPDQVLRDVPAIFASAKHLPPYELPATVAEANAMAEQDYQELLASVAELEEIVTNAQGHPGARKYADALQVVSSELLAQSHRLDERLIGLFQIWNNTVRERLVSDWERGGQDVVSDQSREMLDRLALTREQSRVETILPAVVGKSLSSDQELVADLKTLYQEYYKFREAEYFLDEQIKSLSNCTSKEELEQILSGINHALGMVRYRAEYAHLNQLALLNDIVTDHAKKAAINASLGNLTKLSPKALITQQVADQRRVELIRLMTWSKENAQREDDSIFVRMDEIKEKMKANPLNEAHIQYLSAGRTN